MDKRLNAMNEFRDALKDQAALMATRSELRSLEDKMTLQLRPLQEYKAIADAKASQQSVNIALLLSFAALVVGVIGLFR